MDKSLNFRLDLTSAPGMLSETLSASPSKVRVRCPQCFKLFAVSVHSVNESRPRFACTSCATQFWIPFPECLDQAELLGFPVSWLEESKEEVFSHLKSGAGALSFDSEPSTQLETLTAGVEEQKDLACPKCGSKHGAGAVECVSCGVIFSNFRESLDDANAGFKTTRQLREAWKTLINDFDKPALHEDFIQLCRRENALDYAAYRYGRVNAACPEDEISKSMLNKIETILAVSAGLNSTAPAVSAATSSDPNAVKINDAVAVPIYKKVRISSIVISLGFILMAVGYIYPAFRNIVGLGAATVFLAFAFRMYFPKA